MTLCPKCGVAADPFPMDARTMVAFCPDCKGMWLEKGMLARSCGTDHDVPNASFSAATAVATAYPCPTCVATGERLVKVRYASTSPVEIDTCRQCEGMFLDFHELPEVQKILKATLVSVRPVFSVAELRGEEDELSSARVSYDTWGVSLLTIPLALLFAEFWGMFYFPGQITWYWLSMPTHESGHAIAAWLGGRVAIPLPLFTAVANDERSGSVFFFLVSVFIFFGVYSYRKRRMYPVFLSVGLIAAAIDLTWVVSDPTSRMMFTYGGIGGTFILSTFLIVSFYYRMPDRVRWDFFRFFGVLLGALVLVANFEFWRAIARGEAQLPLGTAIVGRDDRNGDINQLMSEFGWSPKALVGHFVGLGKICFGVIFAHYLYFLRKAYLKRESTPPRTPGPIEVDPFEEARRKYR